MSILGALGAAVGVAQGLSGLFGRKEKSPTPASNLMSQAQGARDAAEKFGFSPLTMLQYGNPGGAIGGSGGPPPLASVDILTGGLKGLDDIVSGDAARRRAADQLEIDMARLKLDQARSGVLAVPPLGVDRVASTPSALGRRPATHLQNNVVPVTRSVSTLPGRSDVLHKTAVGSDKLSGLGSIPSPADTIDRGAGGFVAGLRWEGSPGWSTGDAVSKEYGDAEFLTWPYAFSKFFHDVGYNLSRVETYYKAKRLRSEGHRVYKIGGKHYMHDPGPDPRNDLIDPDKLAPIRMGGFGMSTSPHNYRFKN